MNYYLKFEIVLQDTKIASTGHSLPICAVVQSKYFPKENKFFVRDHVSKCNVHINNKHLTF